MLKSKNNHSLILQIDDNLQLNLTNLKYGSLNLYNNQQNEIDSNKSQYLDYIDFNRNMIGCITIDFSLLMNKSENIYKFIKSELKKGSSSILKIIIENVPYIDLKIIQEKVDLIQNLVTEVRPWLIGTTIITLGIPEKNIELINKLNEIKTKERFQLKLCLLVYNFNYDEFREYSLDNIASIKIAVDNYDDWRKTYKNEKFWVKVKNQTNIIFDFSTKMELLIQDEIIDDMIYIFKNTIKNKIVFYPLDINAMIFGRWESLSKEISLKNNKDLKNRYECSRDCECNNCKISYLCNNNYDASDCVYLKFFEKYYSKLTSNKIKIV